jgi:sulfur-carrier protein
VAIDVRVPTILRTHTDGRRAVQGSGDTLADLLVDLDSQFPGLRERLVTEDGGLHRFVNIYINDEDVRFLGALDAKLADGDTVTILPAVAGGASEARGAGEISRAGGATGKIRRASEARGAGEISSAGRAG